MATRGAAGWGLTSCGGLLLVTTLAGCLDPAATPGGLPQFVGKWQCGGKSMGMIIDPAGYVTMFERGNQRRSVAPLTLDATQRGFEVPFELEQKIVVRGHLLVNDRLQLDIPVRHNEPVGRSLIFNRDMWSSGQGTPAPKP